MHGRDLVDVADELGERSTDLLRRDTAGVGAGDGHALGVAGVAPLAQSDDAVVGLGLGVEVVDEACAAPHADRQQSGGRRIERPRMADASLPEDASNLTDGVE
jgi:hypothetical protein